MELTTGVLGEECSQMMKAFFKELRKKTKKLSGIQLGIVIKMCIALRTSTHRRYLDS